MFKWCIAINNLNQNNNPEKNKKEIKWYTYVDSTLDSKLKKFMDKYDIKNQAKIIRDSVNNYIDYVYQIVQKDIERKEYNEKAINDSIRKAIETFEFHATFNEELKQKLSPLKVSILMLNNFINEPNRLIENIENIKSALLELENSIKRHFEEPKLIRHIQRFDILYIEDNELERKTVDTYFKRKNIDITSKETSEEGLDILNVSTPQVILLDIDLKTSNINGAKLCQMLKSKEQYKTIPIILISAVVSDKEKKEILAITGADHIIIKPIDRLADLDIILKYLK
ncbi:MAG: response regulator [Promethearchaeota archaeon]|nr:MAG: response regulator [Candidatus Lokiarchaeota archaeon]